MGTVKPPPGGNDLEIVINDASLPLSDVEDFAREYTTRLGSDVVIRSRWGGPLAGGPGWGGPEIAVAIVAGEVLRRFASDGYSLVKQFALRAYSKIRTRDVHWYVDGALALGVRSENGALTVLFCFPDSLSDEQLSERITLLESHATEVLKRWESSGRSEVKVCWDASRGTWDECSPKPEGE